MNPADDVDRVNADREREPDARGSFRILAYVSLAVIVVLVAGAFTTQLFCAPQRGKQKRTMAQMRSVSRAVESYRKEHGTLPVFVESACRAEIEKHSKFLTDGWNHRLLTAVRGDSYVIVSTAKDGVVQERDPFTCAETQTTSFNDDIVVRDGKFVVWPEGTQN